MNRDEALSLIKEHVSRESLLKHMFATEAIMRGVAEKLNEDVEIWGLIGLLHDIDFQETEDNLGQHCIKCADILKDKVDDSIIHTIQSHSFGTPCGEGIDVKLEKSIEYALCASDAITGLIIAAALVKPEKKLSAVSVKTIKKLSRRKDLQKVLIGKE